MILRVALDQHCRRFPAELPCRRRRHRAGIDRIEIAPGRQHFGAAAARRPGWAGRHETAVETLEQPRQLLCTAARDGRPQPAVDPVEDGGGTPPAFFRRNLARDEALRQRFQPLDGVAGVAPGAGTRQCRRLGVRAMVRQGRERAGRSRDRDRRQVRATARRLQAPRHVPAGQRRRAAPSALRPRDSFRRHAARRGSATPSVRRETRRACAAPPRPRRRRQCRNHRRCRRPAPAPGSPPPAPRRGADRLAPPRNIRRSAVRVRPAGRSCRRGSRAASGDRR